MSDNKAGFFFILPAAICLIVILGFPAVAAFLQSFDIFWVRDPNPGIDSFIALSKSPEFIKSLSNTLIFVASTVFFHMVIGFSVALLLNIQIPGLWIFRVIAILPWTMPDIIGGLIWRFMFDTLPGVVNSILLQTSIVTEPINWLGTSKLAFLCLIMAESWRGYPFVMLVLLAGLQAIPKSQYEATSIDGANKLQQFYHITIPNMKNMFIIALILDMIWECRLFGMVYGMTGGGPGYSTQVLSVFTYKQYFQFFNSSFAAASAVILALIMLLISYPYLRMSMKEQV